MQDENEPKQILGYFSEQKWGIHGFINHSVTMLELEKATA